MYGGSQSRRQTAVTLASSTAKVKLAGRIPPLWLLCWRLCRAEAAFLGAGACPLPCLPVAVFVNVGGGGVVVNCAEVLLFANVGVCVFVIALRLCRGILRAHSCSCGTVSFILAPLFFIKWIVF